ACDPDDVAADIHTFLKEKLGAIRDKALQNPHALLKDWQPALAIEDIARRLESWPHVSDIEDIVKKSQGLFIYAAVVVEYLLYLPIDVNPIDELRSLRLKRPGKDVPEDVQHRHLDRLYQHILSQFKPIVPAEGGHRGVSSSSKKDTKHLLHKVLALALLDNKAFAWTPFILETILELPKGSLKEAMSGLSSLMRIESADKRITFSHGSSLIDFLADETRSRDHFIDFASVREDLLCAFFEWPADSEMSFYWRAEVIVVLLDCIGTPSYRLRDALYRFGAMRGGVRIDTTMSVGWVKKCGLILERLRRLDFADEGQAYRHVIGVFAAEYAKDPSWAVEYPDVKQAVVKSVPALADGIRGLVPQMGRVLGVGVGVGVAVR
ncbi:hypothetical protein BDN70DRAFT_931216, partial [Pholiota conissans]